MNIAFSLDKNRYKYKLYTYTCTYTYTIDNLEIDRYSHRDVNCVTQISHILNYFWPLWGF